MIYTRKKYTNFVYNSFNKLDELKELLNSCYDDSWQDKTVRYIYTFTIKNTKKETEWKLICSKEYSNNNKD